MLPKHEPLIDLNLLNQMVNEILAGELLPHKPGTPLPRRNLRKTEAEAIDEKLFRQTLLDMPVRRASRLIQLIQPKFYSRTFAENCFNALEALDEFEQAA